MRLLICAGGTGGGVYPALAVLSALQSETDRILWVGSETGMEGDLIRRSGIDFSGIPAAGLHGVGLRALPGNAIQLGRGLQAAQAIARSFAPDVLFMTGGYVGAPMALAARRVPTILFVPDIEPGMALKFLARFADRIAVSVADSHRYFPGSSKVVTTGYPVRRSMLQWTDVQAREVFLLNPDLPTLLVFGGSKGARSLNRSLVDALPSMLAEMQVIHISGELDWTEVEESAKSLPENLKSRYHPFPYLHERMGAALRIADLVVSRAGASTLGEFPLFGLPAILVPYPYAWRYQRVNARYLEDRGAALVIEDDQLSAQLAPTVLRLIRSQVDRDQMRTAMKALAQPDAAARIANLLRTHASQVGTQQ